MCEGAFDALALLAAGIPRVVAIYGGQGWCWAWARHVDALAFALDADTAGQQQRKSQDVVAGFGPRGTHHRPGVRPGADWGVAGAAAQHAKCGRISSAIRPYCAAISGAGHTALRLNSVMPIAT